MVKAGFPNQHFNLLQCVRLDYCSKVPLLLLTTLGEGCFLSAWFAFGLVTFLATGL